MASNCSHHPTAKTPHHRLKIVGANVRRRITDRVAIFRRFFRLIWHRILACSKRMPNGAVSSTARYRKLFNTFSPSVSSNTASYGSGHESDSDLVSLKISTLGDCRIGKTTFLLKYVGEEEANRSLQMKGINVMGKSLRVGGATIGFRIWDVGGDRGSSDQVPIACRGAAAIFFMFDLTSRCTLNSVIGWYNEARKWNQTASLVLIGTKFDDFVQLPHNIQWSVITQARTYARAMKATLFFSSATHNINVNKIFKHITANLFNLPWTVQRNLTIGEPIIDF